MEKLGIWQSRYRAVRLMDEESLLACAAYVDLKAIRGKQLWAFVFDRGRASADRGQHA
jgi:hypothetical protein